MWVGPITRLEVTAQGYVVQLHGKKQIFLVVNLPALSLHHCAISVSISFYYKVNKLRTLGIQNLHPSSHPAVSCRSLANCQQQLSSTKYVDCNCVGCRQQRKARHNRHGPKAESINNTLRHNREDKENWKIPSANFNSK
jgi:hypothetical protein